MPNKTKIEWCDYTINPVKGLCPMACPYCYARAMYKRFKWNPEIRFDDSVLKSLDKLDKKQSQRIFVGSMIELFGDWIPKGWMKTILEYCHLYYHTTFIFLTKQPQNLIEWSPLPNNTYIGVSVCNDKMLDVAVDKLEDVQAKHKFISFEPLLNRLTLSLDYALYYSGIDWVIIGQQTPSSKRTSPKLEWVKEIVEACDKAGTPLFLKNNLMNMFVYNQQSIMLPYWALNKTGEGGLRQEFPTMI